MGAKPLWMTLTLDPPLPLAATLSGDDWMHVVYLVALLAFIASGLVFTRANLRQHIGALATWAAIICVLVLAFAFREEAGYLWQRFASALLPGQVTDTGSELSIERARNGMFSVDTKVNGTPVRFLFDTGASDVLLSDGDARKLGFTLSPDEFRIPVQTANGQTMAARVILQEIVIGNLRRTGIAALIAQPGATDTSLLGHGLLDTIRSYEVRGDRLIIRY